MDITIPTSLPSVSTLITKVKSLNLEANSSLAVLIDKGWFALTRPQWPQPKVQPQSRAAEPQQSQPKPSNLTHAHLPPRNMVRSEPPQIHSVSPRKNPYSRNPDIDLTDSDSCQRNTVESTFPKSSQLGNTSTNQTFTSINNLPITVPPSVFGGSRSCKIDDYNSQVSAEYGSATSQSTSIWSSTDFPWHKQLSQLNKDLFGHSTFRMHQREIINASLSNHDCFVLMPTGGGKTLCYVLSAVIGAGLTVVFSPLVSLIHDQVAALEASDIPAAKLDSSVDTEKYRQVYKNCMDGNIRLLYVCPERLARSNSFIKMLQDLYKQNKLRAFIIDEAHCVSQWGHDFRPDYMELRKLKQLFPNIPITALTATASDRVRENVCSCLQLNKPILFKQSFNRPNLYYEVRAKARNGRRSTNEEKSANNYYVDDMIDFIKTQHPRHCGIVYGYSVKECESMYEALKQAGLSVSLYHGKLTHEQRTQSQLKWSNDEVRIMIGTVAFGMGINKPDVRFVIHCTMPKSVECFYQEAGRAGRDGRNADTIIYYSYSDKARLEWLIRKEVEGPTARDPIVVDANVEKLRSMVAYCEDTVTCRRVQTLAYLGESFDPSKCNEFCDNCRDRATTPTTTEDVTIVAKHICNIIQEVTSINRREEIKECTLIDIYRGSKNRAVINAKYDKLAQYGLGKSRKNVDLTRILHECIRLSILKEVSRPVPNSPYNQTIQHIVLGSRAQDCLKGKCIVQLAFRTSKHGSSENRKNDAHLSEVSEDTRQKQAPARNKKTKVTKSSKKVSIRVNVDVNDTPHEVVTIREGSYTEEELIEMEGDDSNMPKPLNRNRKSSQNQTKEYTGQNNNTESKFEDDDDDDEESQCILSGELREELVLELQRTRHSLASSLEVRDFTIMSQEAMMYMARLLPVNMDQMSDVPLVGSARARKHGRAFLDTIHNFLLRQSNQMRINLPNDKRTAMYKFKGISDPGQTVSSIEEIPTDSYRNQPVYRLDQYRRQPTQSPPKISKPQSTTKPFTPSASSTVPSPMIPHNLYVHSAYTPVIQHPYYSPKKVLLSPNLLMLPIQMNNIQWYSRCITILLYHPNVYP